MEKNLSFEFERALVGIVSELAEKQGLNFAQFAKKAYGPVYGEDTAVTKWRKQRREEKPQSFTVADLYLCAKALGMEPENVIFQSNATLKMKQNTV